MEIHTNKALEELTEKWGSNRKITVNGKIPAQIIKFGEEMGELFEAETKEQTIDAMGDMIIVLSMVANLNKTSISKCLSIGTEVSFIKQYEGHNRLLLLPIVYGKLCSVTSRDNFSGLDILIRDTIHVLEQICSLDKTGMSINECWNHAYDQIKDRTGTLLENGIFVKDEDGLLVDGKNLCDTCVTNKFHCDLANGFKTVSACVGYEKQD